MPPRYLTCTVASSRSFCLFGLLQLANIQSNNLSLGELLEDDRLCGNCGQWGKFQHSHTHADTHTHHSVRSLLPSRGAAGRVDLFCFASRNASRSKLSSSESSCVVCALWHNVLRTWRRYTQMQWCIVGAGWSVFVCYLTKVPWVGDRNNNKDFVLV